MWYFVVLIPEHCLSINFQLPLHVHHHIFFCFVVYKYTDNPKNATVYSWIFYQL